MIHGKHQLKCDPVVVLYIYLPIAANLCVSQCAKELVRYIKKTLKILNSQNLLRIWRFLWFTWAAVSPGPQSLYSDGTIPPPHHDLSALTHPETTGSAGALPSVIIIAFWVHFHPLQKFNQAT